MFNIWIYWRIVLTLYKSITTTFEISAKFEEMDRGIGEKHLASRFMVRFVSTVKEKTAQ